MTQFKTAGVSNQNGDNIIDRTTTGQNAGGITNEPAFPNNNAVNPSGQGDSHVWAGQPVGAPPSGNDVEQAFVGAGMTEDASHVLPEQDFAKPTDSKRPSALGPGMTQG